MIAREQVRDERGRITAGIPSLSPEKRRDITEYHLMRAYQSACQNEYIRNEKSATDPDGDIDVTDWDQVIGIPLHGYRIAIRLRKLNHKLHFEVSHADSSKTGIYELRNDFKGGQEKLFVCGMETELNPEYSLRVLNNDGTPKGIIGGWRRVLMKLIRSRLITESGAWSMFGPPSRNSENWARYTQ